MPSIQPLFASSIFSVSPCCDIYQVLCYDYIDPDGVYAKILHKKEEFTKEIEKLRRNMQAFLSAERIYINNQCVEQQIIHVDIGLRGSADIPYIQWVIFFQGRSNPGDNMLVSDVEEEIAEYDIEVVYLFPAGTKIKEVRTPMDYEIRSPLLLVWARKGDLVGGHEELRFEFASNKT